MGEKDSSNIIKPKYHRDKEMCKESSEKCGVSSYYCVYCRRRHHHHHILSIQTATWSTNEYHRCWQSGTSADSHVVSWRNNRREFAPQPTDETKLIVPGEPKTHQWWPDTSRCQTLYACIHSIYKKTHKKLNIRNMCLTSCSTHNFSLVLVRGDSPLQLYEQPNSPFARKEIEVY